MEVEMKEMPRFKKFRKCFQILLSSSLMFYFFVCGSLLFVFFRRTFVFGSHGFYGNSLCWFTEMECMKEREREEVEVKVSFKNFSSGLRLWVVFLGWCYLGLWFRQIFLDFDFWYILETLSNNKEVANSMVQPFFILTSTFDHQLPTEDGGLTFVWVLLLLWTNPTNKTSLHLEIVNSQWRRMEQFSIVVLLTMIVC